MALNALQRFNMGTGIDWSALVEATLAPRYAEIQRLQQAQQQASQRLDVWSSIESLLRRVTDQASALANLDLARTVKVQSSDPAAVAASAAGGAQPGVYEVVVQQLARAHSVASASPFTGPLGVSGTFELSADGGTSWVAVEVYATDTVEDLAARINDRFTAYRATAGSSAPSIQASVIQGYLVLTRSQTGAVAIRARDGGTNVLESLGLMQPGTGDTAWAKELVTPADASVRINGLQVTTPSNRFTALGIEFTFLQQDPSRAVQVTVTQDRSAIEARVRAFVDAYNAAVDALAKNTARDGTLGPDIRANMLRSGLRRALTDAVDTGSLLNVYAIGLSVSKEGSLQFDAAKFWAEYDRDAQRVQDVVQKTFGRVADYLAAATADGGSVDSAKDALQSRVERLGRDIASAIDRVERERKRLTALYARYEAAILGMQGVLSWLQGLTEIFTNQSRPGRR